MMLEDRAVVIGSGSKRVLGKLAMFYLFSMQVAQELFTVWKLGKLYIYDLWKFLKSLENN